MQGNNIFLADMAKLKEYIRSTDRKNDAPTIQTLSDTINISKELISSLERLSTNEGLLKQALQSAADSLGGENTGVRETLMKNNNHRWWIIPLYGGKWEEANTHFKTNGNFAYEYNIIGNIVSCWSNEDSGRNVYKSPLTATQVGFILEILISKEVPISLEGYK